MQTPAGPGWCPFCIDYGAEVDLVWVVTDLSSRARRIITRLCGERGVSPASVALISKREFYNYPGCGRKTWSEVKTWLSAHHLEMTDANAG